MISLLLLTLGFVVVVVLLLLLLLYPAAVDVDVVKVTQSCPLLCDLMDYTVHGILQAIILELVAVPLSRGSSQTRGQTQVSHIAGRLFINLAIRKADKLVRLFIQCISFFLS